MKHFSILVQAFVLAFVVLSGCNTATRNPFPVVVTIDGEKSGDAVGLTVQYDTLKLLTGDKILGEVTDISASDSCLFVLDESSAIWKFSLKSGEATGYLSATGHSRDEYIMPFAIVCRAGKLYVLDFAGRGILAYDADLKFVDRTEIDCAAMDFAVVEDGFLIYDMDAAGETGCIIYIDRQGNLKGRYLPAEKEHSAMMTNRVFSESDDNCVYYLEPMSNRMYVWNGTEMEPFCMFEFRDKTAGGVTENQSEGTVVLSSVDGSRIVSHYLSGDRLDTHVYDRETRKSCTLSQPVPAIRQNRGQFFFIMHDESVSADETADIMLVSTIN